MVEIQENNTIQIPRTLEEFIEWEKPYDGFKYEWNNGEIVKFEGMKMRYLYIYHVLANWFIEKGYVDKGVLISKFEIVLSKSQVRRPDIAYFTEKQVYQGRQDIDIIPEFTIEVLSGEDKLVDVRDKLIEYFKAGVKVVWHIIPAQEVVYVYTSRSEVKICFDKDICSAKPVLEDFEISVADIFKDYSKINC